MKVCTQCGKLQPLTNYRRYYGGRKGHYPGCKNCERINSRFKYLSSKKELVQAEEEELAMIQKLYETQRKAGYKPPHTVGRSKPLMDDLESLINSYPVAADSFLPEVIPEELAKWLVEPLYEEPDYYSDNIYDMLVANYRPILHYDKDSLLPVYDNTYKETLDKIAKRFDDYEDDYYNRDEGTDNE